MSEYKEFLENQFINVSLKSLFARDLQEKTWSAAFVQGFGDYSELVMSFYDDSEILLAEPKEFGLTSEQIEEIEKLNKMIEEFDQKIPMEPGATIHRAILIDPKWEEIRKSAEDLYKNFTLILAS